MDKHENEDIKDEDDDIEVTKAVIAQHRATYE